MNLKLLGGIMLIVGTSIGGAMLALPIATAQGGFLAALFLFFLSWASMTLGSFLVLEANLWLGANSNIISMAKHTLGIPGKLVAWVTYLLLLYSLLSAYISSGADVLNDLMKLIHHNLPISLAALIFLLVFGSVVFSGIRTTDYVNRLLMFIKLGTFIFLLLLISPHINYKELNTYSFHHIIPATTVIITSFGFATIVPSLRTYFNSDILLLKKALLIGSLIPLLCYIAWIAVILGNLPMDGQYGLLAMLTSAEPTSSLVKAIEFEINNTWVGSAAHIFTSICVATSFLGVSLSLADFLADGIGLQKVGTQKFVLFLLTYVPPFLIAVAYPRAFLTCLSYAGTLCVILLMLLPAFMVWRGRYKLNIEGVYRMAGGKAALIMVIALGFAVIAQDLIFTFGLIKH